MTEPVVDQFYQGIIQKLFGGSRSGIVRSATGREITFIHMHVIFLGEIKYWDDLREGMTVGFDVGWTSSGLRVTMMKVNVPAGYVRREPDA